LEASNASYQGMANSKQPQQNFVHVSHNASLHVVVLLHPASGNRRMCCTAHAQQALTSQEF
jgi:hypothetical protein